MYQAVSVKLAAVLAAVWATSEQWKAKEGTKQMYE